jgi:hypothetical protein
MPLPGARIDHEPVQPAPCPGEHLGEKARRSVPDPWLARAEAGSHQPGGALIRRSASLPHDDNGDTRWESERDVPDSDSPSP